MARRKRTEIEKDNARKSRVDDNGEINKEKQLEKLLNQEIPQGLTQEIIDMFDIKPKVTTAELSGNKIMPFGGKNYKESIELAIAWEKKLNEDEAGKNQIILRDYYPQKAFKARCILASYDIVNLDGTVF